MLPIRGYIFIFLNAVRLLSIIGLLLVFASNVVVLADDIKAVNRFVAQGSNTQLIMTNTTDGSLFDCDMDYIDGSTVPNQPAGVFWAVVNRLLILFEIIVLILSEFNWPRVFFDTWFPVLGGDFGLGPLGVFECLISAAVLSHRVDTFPKVAAFFLFSVGCLNILLGLIFRAKGRSKRSLSSWKETKGVLPTINDANVRPSFTGVSVPSFVSRSSKDESELSEKAQTLGFGRQLSSSGSGFGTKGEKAAGLRGFLITKPLETLPRYAPKADSSFSSSATAV
ncbi:hypothetical protein M422DRAFT_28937 [Sphaerobolus stellatus SS14]|nr:hypothetical protein M422DRAFT_28937 [Sphaerobolus stellatus SS14]